MSTGTRSDFGAAMPSAGRAAHPEAPGLRRVPGADRIAALSALVESITEQLDAMEGAARRHAAKPAFRQPAAEQDRPLLEPDRLGALEARLSAIAGQMAAAQPSSPSAAPLAAAPSRPSAPRSTIAEIAAARRKAIEPDGGHSATVDPRAIEDAIAALRGDIATLARRVGSEARRSEDMDKALRADIAARLDAAPREDGGRFEDLRRPLEDIRQSIAASAREATLASIEAGYSHVIERLDEITRRVPERGRLDLLAEEIGRLSQLIDRTQPLQSMEGELEDIRNQIATFAATRTDPHLERQIVQLRQAVEHLAAAPRDSAELTPLRHDLAVIRREVDGLAKHADPALVVRLEQQVAAVRGLMERLAGAGIGEGAALSRLEERIDALSGRIDAIIDLPVPHARQAVDQEGSDDAVLAAIDALGAEVAALRSHVVEREPLRFDAIDRGMQLLMERLDVASERDDGHALALLEAQLAGLAEKIVEGTPVPDALSRVEEDIGRLQSLIGQTRAETMELARGLARDALSEFAGRLPVSSNEALIQSLREDLRNLQAAASTADRQNHDTLETVHETLTRLVERIARLEAEQHPQEDEDRASVVAPIPSRRFGDGPEDHRPLAPGSGKPGVSKSGVSKPGAAKPGVAKTGVANPDGSFARAASSAGPGSLSSSPAALGSSASQAPQRSLDRKADFIAAARRAAQAAQAEAAEARRAERDTPPDLDADEAGGHDGSDARLRPLARIGRLLHRRRRSVALAIAAVLLAIGAAKYGEPLAEGLFVGGGSPPADKERSGSLVPSSWRRLAERSRTMPDHAGDLLDSASPVAAAGAILAAGSVPEAVVLDMQAVSRDAVAGDPLAAFELGKAYAEGIGVTRDAVLAARWYVKAARAGLAVAQYRLGSLYERGEGVLRDPAEAQRWYRKASDQGNARAMHNLAVMVGEGAGAAPDLVAAARLFTAAGDLGLADSQYNLGVLYARGLGVEVDLVQSYTWFALAAQQGDADAVKRRDIVAAALGENDLVIARAAVQAFRPRPQKAGANGEPIPKADWLLTASTAASIGRSGPG